MIENTNSSAKCFVEASQRHRKIARISSDTSGCEAFNSAELPLEVMIISKGETHGKMFLKCESSTMCF